MTSLEWVEVKKRLAKKENAICKALADRRGEPNDVYDDESKNMVRTNRGKLVDELSEIQDQRNRFRPKRRR